MSFEGFTEDDIIKLKNKQRTTNAGKLYLIYTSKQNYV